MSQQKKGVPPDGGWGWIVVIANSICSIATLPVITNFGLIFKDKLQQLQMPTTNTSLIINLSSVFSMSMGLVTGPLLKIFGYRCVAFAGGLLFSIGIIATAFAVTFQHFLITYSIIAGAGSGLATAAHSLALNTYFVRRRNKAAGISMTLNGLGPICYPPLITALLIAFGVQGCVLLLGIIGAHTLVAALLLQPVKRHLTDVTTDGDICQELESKPIRNSAVWDYTSEEEEEYLEKPLREDDAGDTVARNGERVVNFRLPPTTIAEKPFINEPIINGDGTNNKEERRTWLVALFDLDLLKDKIFVNIIFGMAIAAFAEINFSVLTPFILSELNYTNFEIASALSALAITDIGARFVSPFIGDSLNVPVRVMYMISLMLLIITRSSILAVRSYTDLLIVSIAMGLAKGIRTVYMILVIPSHVPIDKLASASGIRMVSNAVVLLCLGPAVGFIRDSFGNYALCIVFMNCVTMLCILMWLCEMLYVHFSDTKHLYDNKK